MSRYFLRLDNVVSIVRMVESADPVDLARRVNLALAELAALTGGADGRLLFCNLSGAGDGHSFTVELGAAGVDPGIVFPDGSGFPIEIGLGNAGTTGLVATCYMAANAVPSPGGELFKQREKVLTASPLGNKVYDEMQAGASQGLRVMGLILANAPVP